MAKSRLQEIREVRLQKVAKLREMGIDPYPSKVKKDFAVQEVVDHFSNFEGKEITICGRLTSLREHGKLAFGHVQDESGRIQLFIQSNVLEATSKEEQNIGYNDLSLIDIGDFLEATGLLTKTSRGEISLSPRYLKIISKSIRPLPEKWEGIADPEILYRKRYLDFVVNPQNRDLFKRKAAFWKANRDFLESKGFLEIETPVLEHVTGGADARPFKTHHNALNTDFYLRISTELPQKRLIGGGFEKIFTLGPNFRNEGIDDEHLQEYTQVEWYWAYANFRDNMRLVQEMFRYIGDKVYGKSVFTKGPHTFDLSKEWEEIDYAQTIQKHIGINIFEASDEEMYKALLSKNVKLAGEKNKGRLVDNLWKIVRKEITGPAFLVNEPKFVSPLAKSSSSNPEITERFHVIIAGTELGNGYSELNDPVDQYNRFLEQQRLKEAGDEEAQMMDIDFVEMLEYGMPPVTGYGHSERVFWFLENIGAREAVFFPQMRPALDENTSEIYPEYWKMRGDKTKQAD